MNGLISYYLRRRYKRVEYFSAHAPAEQGRILDYLLKKCPGTAFGREHHIESGMKYSEFSGAIPVRRYEDFFPYIERCMRGEEHIVWPEHIRYFSKSSGTTNAQSKKSEAKRS